MEASRSRWTPPRATGSLSPVSLRPRLPPGGAPHGLWDETLRARARPIVGADRVMLGSDYCFDMGYTRPRRIIEQLGLRAVDRAKILRGNAAKLLRVR